MLATGELQIAVSHVIRENEKQVRSFGSAGSREGQREENEDRIEKSFHELREALRKRRNPSTSVLVIDRGMASSSHQTTGPPFIDFWHPDKPFRPVSRPFFYGWWIVIVGTIGMLFSIPGQTMGFSVFTEILMEELGLSRVALSAAYCVGTVGSGLTLPWMGKLYDEWGGRKLAVAAVFGTSAVLVYLSLTGTMQRLLMRVLPEAAGPVIGFLLIGLGFYLVRMAAQGVLTMSCRNLMGEWFDVRRGLAMSLSGLAVSFAFSAAPTFLDYLISNYTHTGAWFILAALSAGVMAPLAYIVFRDTPEQCGMVMDGCPIVSGRAENPDMVIHSQFTREEAVRTWAFWSFSLSFSFFSFFSTAFTFHIVSIGEEFGFEKGDIIALFIPMAAVSVVVGLFFGWINSRTRLKWLLVGMNLGAVAGAAGLMVLHTEVGKWAYVIGNGFCGGGFMALSGLVWPRFFGRERLGAISGLNMSLIVIASGIGPLLFGISKQWVNSYVPILIVSVIIPAVLAVLALKADNPQRR
jgi:MFS family permease